MLAFQLQYQKEILTKMSGKIFVCLFVLAFAVCTTQMVAAKISAQPENGNMVSLLYDYVCFVPSVFRVKK